LKKSSPAEPTAGFEAPCASLIGVRNFFDIVPT